MRRQTFLIRNQGKYLNKIWLLIWLLTLKNPFSLIYWKQNLYKFRANLLLGISESNHCISILMSVASLWILHELLFYKIVRSQLFPMHLFYTFAINLLCQHSSFLLILLVLFFAYLAYTIYVKSSTGITLLSSSKLGCLKILKEKKL